MTTKPADPYHPSYLRGRHTRILQAASSKFVQGSAREALVAKLSWTDSDDTRRLNLEEALRTMSRTLEMADRKYEVFDPLPVVVEQSDRGHPHPTTVPLHITVSSTMDEDSLGRQPRVHVLRLSTTHKLEIIERLQLDGVGFLKAFFEIERCKL